jgi:hypothetical protein
MNTYMRFLIAIQLLCCAGLLSGQLPEDFPSITTVQTGETGSGPVFLAVASEAEGVGYYAILLNNDGTILDYRELDGDYAYDFKMHPNGRLSYAQFLSHHSYTGGGNVIQMITDTNLDLVDSIQMKNGYIAEAHDFQILPNGHYLVFGYYLTPGVDMSAILKGAHPSAFVSGGIVQELDADKNLVWQWRSWDHYEFEDYPFSGNRAKRETVSAFHLNTIGLDYDDHLLLATPGWVRKINRQTGETVWDLGGDYNDFSFIGVDSTDAVDHFEGHAFYLLENGNYLVYDNGGPRRKDPSSEVHEYSLDQENMIATHVWTYARENDTIGAWHRGNAYRLPNGNTMIGWGGADYNPIPTATEVDQEGNIVFEAFFDNPNVESYRAFRFPLDIDAPDIMDEKEEISTGEYEFIQGDTLHTGVIVDVEDRQGDGYNTLTIKRYHHAPMDPEFPGRAPMVKAERVVMETFGITSLNGQIHFQSEEFGIRRPADATVYYRPFEGNGLFIPLNTSYNPVKKLISADFNQIGEYILTWPDVEVVSLPAKLVLPSMGEAVNQDLPVHMEWAPDGFFTSFQLKIGRDKEFNSLVLDTIIKYSSVYTFLTPEAGQEYHWAVKTLNGADDSEWSDTAMFQASPPAVRVTSPNEELEWQVGLDYWVTWDDNITEDVVIELWKADAPESVIDTAKSTGAYKWSIPADIATGTDYSIAIRSLGDASVEDVSDAQFALIDTVTTGFGTVHEVLEFTNIYPNPVEEVLQLEYSLSSAGVVWFRLYTLQGSLVRSEFLGHLNPGVHRSTQDLTSLPSQTYILELWTGKDKVTRKVVKQGK